MRILPRCGQHFAAAIESKSIGSSSLEWKVLDGIWIINEQGETVYANDFMAEILGTTTDNLIGKDSFLFVYPEDLPAAQRLFSQKQAGSAAPFQFKLRRADGTSIWVRVQGTPMHNAAGNFAGIVGSFSISGEQAGSAAG